MMLKKCIIQWFWVDVTTKVHNFNNSRLCSVTEKGVGEGASVPKNHANTKFWRQNELFIGM